MNFSFLISVCNIGVSRIVCANTSRIVLQVELSLAIILVSHQTKIVPTNVNRIVWFPAYGRKPFQIKDGSSYFPTTVSVWNMLFPCGTCCFRVEHAVSLWNMENQCTECLYVYKLIICEKWRLSHKVKKNTFWHVCPAKTQVSLCSHAVWSVFIVHMKKLCRLSNMCSLKILIRLPEFAGRFESSLGAHIRTYVFTHCGSDFLLSNDEGTGDCRDFNYFLVCFIFIKVFVSCCFLFNWR